MRRDVATILRDAITAGEQIIEMLDGVDEPAFLADRKTQLATERSFEIIGEALSRLSRDFPDVASRIPESRRVVDFRNVLAHGYDVIDARVVYRLARTRLPKLLAAIEAEL